MSTKIFEAAGAAGPELASLIYINSDPSTLYLNNGNGIFLIFPTFSPSRAEPASCGNDSGTTTPDFA